MQYYQSSWSNLSLNRKTDADYKEIIFKWVDQQFNSLKVIMWFFLICSFILSDSFIRIVRNSALSEIINCILIIAVHLKKLIDIIIWQSILIVVIMKTLIWRSKAEVFMTVRSMIRRARLYENDRSDCDW